MITTPAISLVKLTNGTNNDNPPVAGVPDGPIVPVGSTVTWTKDVHPATSRSPRRRLRQHRGRRTQRRSSPAAST